MKTEKDIKDKLENKTRLSDIDPESKKITDRMSKNAQELDRHYIEISNFKVNYQPGQFNKIFKK